MWAAPGSPGSGAGRGRPESGRDGRGEGRADRGTAGGPPGSQGRGCRGCRARRALLRCGLEGAALWVLGSARRLPAAAEGLSQQVMHRRRMRVRKLICLAALCVRKQEPEAPARRSWVAAGDRTGPSCSTRGDGEDGRRHGHAGAQCCAERTFVGSHAAWGQTG